MWFTWWWYILSFVWLVASSKVLCADHPKINLLHQIRCTFDVHVYQLTHHALSKEMTADATLEALEGTSFTGFEPVRMEIFYHLFCFFVSYHYYVRYYSIYPMRYIYIHMFCWYITYRYFIALNAYPYDTSFFLVKICLNSLLPREWRFHANPSNVTFPRSCGIQELLGADGTDVFFEKSENANHLSSKRSKGFGKIAG